jgi:hypothetical protein
MPSRLEELKDLRDMVRENQGVATSIDLSELEDLLAVVSEAKLTADHLRDSFTSDVGQGCCKNRIIALKSALAKLEEDK